METTVIIAAGEFRVVAARCQERADMTAKLALRGAYRQLAMEYMKLAVQQETIERLHALISRLDADAPARSYIGRAVATPRSSGASL
jgi:hypothetical protein